MQFSSKRNYDLAQLYRGNYSCTDIQYWYEKRTELDQTTLDKGRLPFKKMTAVSGFANLMFEEADVRKNMLDTDYRKKHSIVIK